MSTATYIIAFFTAFFLAVIFTYLAGKFARRVNLVDSPDEAPARKIQKAPIPLLGGLAVFLAFFLTVLIFWGQIITDYILPKYLVGIFVASCLLMIGGCLDDRYHFTAKKQIIWPILATLTAIGFGIGVKYITNPLGGVIWLDLIKIKILTLGSLPYYLTLLADLFAFFWLLGMMYTTKLLDGLDGLLSGVTVIASFVIFFMSLAKDVSQPATGLLSLILAGVCFGFLFFNWHPARIFLGEGGSLWCGFMLGVLSIISGGKIATALLIMGIPILDVIWVIIRRAVFERRSPFLYADKKHLHFRLLSVGFSHRGAVLFLYFLTLVFGSTTLFFHGLAKLVSLVVLVFVMIFLGMSLAWLYQRKNKEKNKPDLLV